HYEVQISTNNAFSTLTDGATNLTASEFTPATDLAPNTTYYWRVRAFNALDQTLGWSAVHTFRTALLPPTLVSPTNSEHVLTSRPTFTWNPVSGATGYTVQISKFQNFSSLLTSGTPATATFIPSVNLPANSTLYWRVQTRGVNGPSVWTEIPARSFTTANPPSAPVLASPANNSLSKLYPPVLPLLKWNKSTLPTGSFAYYWVQVATDAAFNNLVVNDNNITDINTIQFPSGTALTANTTYYWRVGAYNQFNPPPNGEYNWSSVFTFRTILDKPALNQFAEGANPLTLRPTFSWGPIAGASKYTVQISKVSNFSSILMSGTPITNSFTPATNLPANTPLFWRVQALGANGPSAWSGTTNYSFNSPNPPNAPLLVSPATGATVTSSTPTLTWSASTLPIPADHYVVEIASNSNFASIVQPSGNISGTTNYTVSPALPSGLYYWRVKAYNASNQYSISATRYFKIP
ncbi:MAG TPA: fibronectin type III domain-containing protein, partial [Anaerolineales bacterium]|nr:fibronectin type III domain-containing protein [Anaerolineales bacterium]